MLRQWGNLLVLSACYRDPLLRSDVDGGKLRDLFVKTIAFLKQVSAHSSALRVDLRFLEKLYPKMFQESLPTTIQPNSSFSSTTSGPTPGQPQPGPMGPAQGQGNMPAPMGPPDHAGMTMPPRLPVGGSPPGREMTSSTVSTQSGPMGSVQATPMVPGPIGLAPIEPEQPAMVPQHHPNMMQ